MTGTASNLWIDKVDKESDGRDYGKREVDSDGQSSSALAVYLTMDAQTKDKKHGDQPENIPGRIKRMIDGGSPVKKRG
jgi:hypothetical protein